VSKTTCLGEGLLQRFHYGLARLGVALVPPLSRRTVLALARVLGAAGYRLLARDRAIARANLAMAYGEALSSTARDAIVREAFHSFTRTMLDSIWFLHDFPNRMARWIRVEPSMTAWTESGPIIAVTAHLGNWELLGQTGVFLGAPPLSVAARSRNETLDRFFASQRARHGMRIVWREGALRVLCQELSRGGRVAMVLDQHIRPSEGAAWVRFFGRLAAMSPAAALLARRYAAPILPAFCVGEADGGYRAFAHPPIFPDGPADLNQAIADAFEREIRACPGQWLWMYKRWKYVPSRASADEYPFYAHPSSEG
jgi:KDO2-lipid IV(A) lauroyltransferase